MSKVNLYSAGYTGSRLCRAGSSAFSRIEFDPAEVIFFTSGWKFNLFYTRQKQWYACGDNECDQIGASASELTDISLIKEMNIVPLWAACGDKMTAIVSADGSLYVAGASYGNFRQPVQLDRPIRFVACGTEFVVAIPQGSGIFFSQGGNSNFKYVSDEINFIDCAAGQYHFLAIADTGVAYSWGRRKASGQGRKFSNNTPHAIHVEEDVKFKRCFSYNIASFLIDENDDVWSCGANNYGQIGLNRVNKTNTFKKLNRFWQSPVVHIACGDSMAYFLTDDGKLYSCGESDNSRLLMNDSDSHRVPTLCEKTNNINVIFMASGCSHVVILGGEKPPDFLAHPIISMLNRSSFCHVPIFLALETKISKKPINMDISPSGLASHGYQINDIISMNSSYTTSTPTPTTTTTTTTNETKDSNSNDNTNINDSNENKGNNQERCRVLGIAQDGSIVVESNGSIKLIKEESVLLQKHFRIVERKNSKLQTVEGRSSLRYDIDTSDRACLLFGFKSGEHVFHECFGEGTVMGTFGSRLFFIWSDEGKMATGSDCSVFNLHNLLKIIEPRGRSIERVQLQNENYINVETEPCNLLHEYGIHQTDIIRSGEKYGTVIGQFAFHCVARDILTNNIFLCQLNELQLIRTYSKETVCISCKSFNGKIVNVSVNCSKEDEFLPFDRVLTKKGLATIVGRSEDLKDYWILTDSALKLNAGAVICKDITGFQIVRRIDAPSSDTEINNSLNDFKGEKVLPGDVVLYKNKNYLVIGRNKADELVLQTKEGRTCSKDESIEVIYRSDLPCQRNFPSRQNFRLLFDVDSPKFKGLRVLPGDRVSTNSNVATVIGFKANDIWIKYDDAQGAGTIPQQMIFDSSLFKVVKSVCDDL